MSTSVEVLSWGVAAALCAVAAFALRDALASRDRSRLVLAAALGLLGAIAVLGRVTAWVYEGRAPSFILIIALFVFAASGYAFVEYRATIVRLSAKGRATVAGAAVGAVVFVLGAGPATTGIEEAGVLQRLAAVAVIGVWSVSVGDSAFRLWAASRHIPPTERARLRAVSGGFVVVAFAIVVAQAFRQAFGEEAWLSILLHGIVLFAIPALYAAVAPPLRLRRWWLRRASRLKASQLVPVGAWYWDAQTGLEEWSEAMHETLGTHPSRQLLCLEDYVRIIHPQDREWVLRRLDGHYRSAEPFTYDHRIVRADGEVRWLHVLGEVVCAPETGEVVAMLGTVQDITERKHAEEALRTALEREKEAAEDLRAVNQMKDEFLSAVSHELRTPLTSVIGFAHTLTRPDLPFGPEQIRDLASRIVANGERLERLLTDLLDLDRLARGTLEPQRRLADMHRLVERVVEHVSVGERSLEVDVAPVIAMVSSAQTERIVDNLLANAIRHTPRDTSIWLRVRGDEQGVLIVVEDDGPGVPKELRRQIFEPFDRGREDVKNTAGTGIGLALVDRFAELHGGKAWVEDRPGGGASFHVYLPNGPPGAEGMEISVPEAAREVSR